MCKGSRVAEFISFTRIVFQTRSLIRVIHRECK